MTNRIFYFYLLSLFLGSSVFLPSFTTITPMACMMTVSFILILGSIFKKKIFLSASMMFILSFTLLAFIIDFFYAIFNGTEISYPLYKLHIILVIFILSNLNFSDDYFYANISKLLKNATIGMFIICLYQQLVALSLLPAYSFVSIRYVYDNLSLVSGGFGNPNNQAVVSLLLVLLYAILMKNNLIARNWFPLVYILNFFIIIVTTSRTVLVLYILLTPSILFNLQANKKKVIVLLVAFLMCCAFLIINSSSGEIFISRTLTKIGTIFNSNGGDESFGIRFTAYLYFVENFVFYPLGFGPGNFKEFYLASSFFDENPYFAESPHSFFFEMFLTYGVISLLVIFFLALIVIKTQKNVIWCNIFYFAFLICSFVPSSIMKMPCVFFMLLIPIVINQRLNCENSHRMLQSN
ncbi:O-antigen ligase family protein [Escherichia coli]|nr:O-antigen ligase family protein [Escherichia coli]